MIRNRNTGNKVLIKSEVAWGGLVEAIAGFLFFGAIFIYLLIGNDFLFQIGVWFVLGIFGGISAYSILTLRHFKRIWVFANHIEIKTLGGNIIHSINYSDITNWRQHKTGLGSNWNFKLTTKTKKVNFKSIYISNFSEIADYLEKTLGKEKRELQANNKSPFILLPLGLGLLFFGALLLSFGSKSLNKHRVNLETRLITIEVVLDKKPTIEYNKSRSYVLLKSQTHPNLRFEIDEFLSQSDYINVLREYLPYQTAKLTIYETDYKKYISKETPITFWDKQANYQSIEVYGLLSNNTYYLNPKDAITEATSWFTRLLTLVFTGFFLIMMLGGIMLIYVSLKNNYLPNKNLNTQ